MEEKKTEEKQTEKKQTAEQSAISKPHDKGYKRDLKNPREFLHFLKKYVKAEWAKDLKVSQLKLCDKEFISRDYEGKEADLIYEITLGTDPKSEKKLYVFILQELQSSVDYTMIFRVMVYIMDTMLRYFMKTEKNERERADFRLPAVVPVLFYNGCDRWTAVKNLRDYQMSGELFGTHILNLEYYLVDLNEIKEDYILTTNTVLDNIMYCDKLREKVEIADAVRQSFQRVSQLGRQEEEEFAGWVKNILLSICGNKESVVKAIMEQARNGDEDVAFQYNIVRIFEEEKAEERAEGRAEGELLKLISLLRKKYQKGRTMPEAADELEEECSVVRPFYDLIAQYPQEGNEEILDRYKKTSVTEA